MTAHIINGLGSLGVTALVSSRPGRSREGGERGLGGLPKLVAGSDACKVAAVGGCAGKWGAEGWDSRKERGC